MNAMPRRDKSKSSSRTNGQSQVGSISNEQNFLGESKSTNTDYEVGRVTPISGNPRYGELKIIHSPISTTSRPVEQGDSWLDDAHSMRRRVVLSLYIYSIIAGIALAVIVVGIVSIIAWLMTTFLL